MEIDRRTRISDLYHRALACEPGARSAFLKDASGGDEALRQELESLLAYEPAAAHFLEGLAVDLAGALGPVLHTTPMIGRRLGPYVILAPLGAGGMGEVYRARDSKLGRDVAIKILPPLLTADPERRARFAREARLLAALNHPHIAAIYGVEEADGVSALVLELVEGPTLADVLEPGPLPLAQALVVARQIAGALSAAHDAGIVHRDLKPANVVLQGFTRSGAAASDPRVKILDFGLAKTMVPDADADPALTRSRPGHQTIEGRILGTPAYMSPQQARGEAVDKRADVWAFGCVLFEMLTGRRPFDADTPTDTLARILERDPDWSRLDGTPPAVRRLIERCLRKDPAKRLHDIADAALEIDERELAVPIEVGRGAAAPTRLGRASLGWMAACVLLAAVAAWAIGSRPQPTAGRYVELTVPAPEGAELNRAGLHFALSPDGTHLVFIALVRNRSTLWVRSLDRREAWRLPGTEGAAFPFWRPDSQQIGFFAEGKLRTVAVNGGAPTDVCDHGAELESAVAGGTWNRDDVIVFGSGIGPLKKVSAKSGIPTTLTTLDAGDVRHRWPAFLPDGRHFLFLAQRANGHELRVGSLDAAGTTSVGPAESPAMFASGHLLRVAGGRLLAQPFDLGSLSITGDARPIADVSRGLFPPSAVWPFSASDTGIVAYPTPIALEQLLTWRSRTGQALGTVGPSGIFANLDLSPDQTRVAVASVVDENWDIWVADLRRGGARERVTTDPGQEFDPAWSPDGRWLAFPSNRTGTRSLYRRRADASGDDELLWKVERGGIVSPDWSPDGRYVLTTMNSDLWVCPLDAARPPFRFGPTDFRETSGVFSPDGHWIAFASDRSGRSEIYISAFPSGAGPYPVSIDGGFTPRWTGTEVFFLSPDGTLMAARIETTPRLHATAPVPLFQTRLSPRNQRPFAVAPDGQRFLMPVAIGPFTPDSITVGVDWTAKLPH